MKRTISIRLETTKAQSQALCELREAFLSACTQIVPFARENRCWNRVALHHLVYSKIREHSRLGSQMVCNAIFAVCKAYKSRALSQEEEVPLIRFHKQRSVHFDRRTYTFKGTTFSLYTLNKRITVPFHLGAFQQRYLANGLHKEAELVCKKGRWYLQLVLDLPNPPLASTTSLLGVDLGENVLAATSSGKLFGGGKIRHERDQHLAKRQRLQSNGSQSAKQLLKKISGKEARRMRQVNHEVSKQIVEEAVRLNAGIVLEDLKNIRKRMRLKKRMRTRLHRWSFSQLRMMIQYKAEARGLSVRYVHPAYSSQTCSQCDCLGARRKHLFVCSCGNQQHSDLNASRTLCRFAQSIGYATCAVNRTQVAASVS